MAGTAAVLAYFFWYSRLDRSAPTPIAVGGTLPELGLRDADGNAVPVSNERHALYMFVRGNWCPLCMAQLREIAAQYRELEARGVDITDNYRIRPEPATFLAVLDAHA